ncbi:MAG TPA: type VI secretion protein IcmF/TssM N-terminal domain-containing protein [Methylomirabilota bacterium]|jgi:type VI secretion system protein ImpL
MTAHFEHAEGSKKGQIESFDSDRIRIGRKTDNDLRFDAERDREVSGYHAEVYREGSVFFLRDLRSTNGTYLNARRIDEPTPIADGDIIQLSARGPKMVFSVKEVPRDEDRHEDRAEIREEREERAFAARAPAVEAPRPAPVSNLKQKGEAAAAALETARRTWWQTTALAALLGISVGATAAVVGGIGWWWTAGWSWWWFLAGLVAAVVALSATLGVRWFLLRRRERAEKPEAEAEKPAAGGEGLGVLREKWADGLATLRKSKLQQRGDDALYALPWVLVLGERGSGKTGTIRAARPLPSPASTTRREGAVKTRTCDWWFFDELVVLETAGRYAFPEEEADSTEWKELLSLLRRARRREPLNGVVLAVPADALSRPVEKLRDEAVQLRRRLDEMSRQLGTRFPVYLLVTNADAIAGFTEFFGRLPEPAWRQAFGNVNDDLENRTGAPAFVERTFRTLAERMEEVRLAFMDDAEQVGTDALREVFLFPEEFRALRRPLESFVEALFRRNSYQETPHLRGLFFTSVGQDRIPLSRVAERLGFQHPVPERVTVPRSFFVRDFFTVVLPQDRPLVRRTAQWYDRYRTARLAAFAAVIALSVGLCGLFTLSFFGNRRVLTGLDVESCIKTPGGNNPIAAAVGQLDTCRATIETLNPRPFWRHLALDFGLRHTQVVDDRLRATYVRAYRRDVLDPLDTALDRKLAVPREAPVYVGALLRRIRAVGTCIASACAGLEDAAGTSHRVLLTAQFPETRDTDPLVVQLARTEAAYLRWHTDHASLEQLRNKDIARVTQWVTSGGLKPEYILVSASAQFPPVRAADFWGFEGTGQVDAPFTARAWKDGIQPLLAGLREMPSEGRDLKDAVDRFESGYRSEGLRQWVQFLITFPRGERSWSRGAGREFAIKALGADSPYERVIDVAAANVGAFAARSGAAVDLPSWAETLQRYAAVKARAAEAQKLKPEEARTKYRDDEREALGYLGRYVEAVDQVRGELGSVEKGARSAQKAFEEGQVTDRSAHPLLKANWNLQGLRGVIGARQGEDQMVWTLLARPLQLGWRVMVDDAGVQIQQQWEVLWLDIAELGPNQKASRVVGFVNGPAAVFIERRGERYAARRLLNENVAFTTGFLDFLSRTRLVAPDPAGKFDPPRQIVATL